MCDELEDERDAWGEFCAQWELVAKVYGTREYHMVWQVSPFEEILMRHYPANAVVVAPFDFGAGGFVKLGTKRVNLVCFHPGYNGIAKLDGG